MPIDLTKYNMQVTSSWHAEVSMQVWLATVEGARAAAQRAGATVEEWMEGTVVHYTEPFENYPDDFPLVFYLNIANPRTIEEQRQDPIPTAIPYLPSEYYTGGKLKEDW